MQTPLAASSRGAVEFSARQPWPPTRWSAIEQRACPLMEFLGRQEAIVPSCGCVHGTLGRWVKNLARGSTSFRTGTSMITGAWRSRASGSRVAQLHFLALYGHFGRHLQVDVGPRTSCAHLPERLGHRGGDLAGAHGLPPPLGHGRDNLRLFEHFMDRTQVLAHLSARYLAGNEKHRRGAGVGGGESGGGTSR